MSSRHFSSHEARTGPTAASGRPAITPTLLPLLDASVFPSPNLDARIGALARRAQAGDRGARDALFTVVQPKLDRMVARFSGRAWSSAAWDLADLRQEAYLAFTDLVAAWPGRGSFTAYLLRCFRGRLIDAVRRMEGRVRHAPLVDRAAEVDPGLDESEVRATVLDLTAGWPEPDRVLLMRHVCDGETIAILAADLGIDVRVAYGRLRTMRLRLRRTLVDELRRERRILRGGW